MRSKRGKTASRAAEKVRANPDESPLTWLARRRDRNGQPLISGPQLLAGEKLRADFTFAQMMPNVTTDYSGVVVQTSRRLSPGSDACDGVVAAGERVRRALRAVGPELAGVLIDICCHCKGLEETERRAEWPQRAGKVVLDLALTRLARHYGIERDPYAPQARTRQWGTTDFRPLLAPDPSTMTGT